MKDFILGVYWTLISEDLEKQRPTVLRFFDFAINLKDEYMVKLLMGCAIELNRKALDYLAKVSNPTMTKAIISTSEENNSIQSTDYKRALDHWNQFTPNEIVSPSEKSEIIEWIKNRIQFLNVDFVVLKKAKFE
jgi:hypothetical protein